MRYRITDRVPYRRGALSEYEIFLKFRDEYPENAIAQSIFLHKYTKQFFETVERRILPKVLKDISYILRKGWAERIPSGKFGAQCRCDFYHCHILGEFNTVISGREDNVVGDLDKIVSSISLLYHTREFRGQPDSPEHNVLSSLTSEPKTVDPSRLIRGKRTAANHLDLDKIHLVELNFRIDHEGDYELEDGKKLDVEGILSVDPTRTKKAK
jgi:hypothetical protein